MPSSVEKVTESIVWHHRTMTGGRTAGTAFALRDPYPWGDLAALARRGEELGYRALFLPEVGSRDTLAALTGLAGETRGILLGTGVVPLPSRAPWLLAAAGATVQERSGGRLLLGLGTGPSGPGALDRLRGTVSMLRTALSGGAATLPDGTEFRLGLVPERAPQIWIAALGPKAMRLAGEVADGVLLNWCTPERVARAKEELAEGAAAAGRDPDAISVGVYVRACVEEDAAAALAAVQAAAGRYATYPAYARQFASMGLGEDAERSAAAHRHHRPDDVSEHLVREVCLVGEPSVAAGRLESYRRAGADLPVVYPVVPLGPDPAASARVTLEALGPAR
jgi:5,10-methylenetetrahydromethanopterin reductase